MLKHTKPPPFHFIESFSCSYSQGMAVLAEGLDFLWGRPRPEIGATGREDNCCSCTWRSSRLKHDET